MITFFATVFVLGILIIFHEFGHFIVARKSGVRVERFSVGFGPVLFRIKRGETEYTLSLIPLGGYVKLAGEEKGEAKGESYEFYSKPPGIRMLIVGAGPLMSFVLAFIIFFFTYSFGYPVLEPRIGKVLHNYPAEKYGLKSGDKVIEVNGKKVKSWEDMAFLIKRSNGKEVSLKVLREDKVFNVKIKPKREKTKNIWGKEVETWLIGIVPSKGYFTKREPPWKALYLSGAKVFQFSYLFIEALGKLIIGQISFKELGGPVLVAQMAGEEARQGFLPLVLFVAFISINLGVINLFPFPVLDGGYLMLLFVEKLRGRPLNKRVEGALQQVGIFLIILLMLMATMNDIQRLKGKKLHEKNTTYQNKRIHSGR